MRAKRTPRLFTKAERMIHSVPGRLQISRAVFSMSGGNMMFEIWVSVALLGLWSCVGVLYNNSRKASRQFDEMVRLLAAIEARK